MNRIPDQRYATVIGEALAILPQRIADRLTGVRFVCGVDPGFAGLHAYGSSENGYAYSTTAHCCFPYHLRNRPAAERPTTVVLPYPPALTTVVHELGHALDWSIGRTHTAAPVTDYARTDRDEAFAEAFTTWKFWGYGDEAAFRSDGATVALFEELAA